MIIVTGGAGFIGSNLVISLQEKGHTDIVVCDDFGDGEKWQNLRKHGFYDLVSPEDLFTYLVKHQDEIEMVFHMGDLSSTTEADVDGLLKNNFTFSVNLWEWCTRNNVRLVYASSATTYGLGENGFEDNQTPAYLSTLKPLTAHAWSKHLFDLHAARAASVDKAPPQWVGLKFFNSYGPNEYHKGEQQSVLCQKYPRAKENLKIQLFRSQNEKFGDGEQMRDFVYVKDCCDVMIWMMEHKHVTGIFNVGSGTPRTFNDMANALYKTLGHDKTNIEYVDMPVETAAKYQYKTQANLTKLRTAGYVKEMTTLEEGTLEFIQNYLQQTDHYR
jgi:ADP-L-glycero-D-manno-heptose 6-epimerase